MTAINAKTIKTKDVQAAYDLSLAFFEADPEIIPGDQSAQDHVLNALSGVLTTLSYPRAGNVAALIRSHNAGVKAQKTSRATVNTAGDSARLIAEMTCNTTFVPDRAEDPDQSENTEEASNMDKEDGSIAPKVTAGSTDADDSASVDTEADIADLPVAGTFTVAPGAEAVINPTIQAATNNTLDSITTLIAGHDRVAAKIAEVNAIIEAHDAVISAYSAGEEDVDESGIVKPEKFTLTGFADLDTTTPLVVVLDTLITQHVSPETSFGDIINTIRAGEQAIAESATKLKTLGRKLRQVRPKTRQKIHAEPQQKAFADTLSEIDEINDSVEVVMEAAADLFPNCYGASQNILQFDVPKLEFDGDHPNVPVKDDSFRFNTRVVVEALHSIAENEIIWLYGDAGCGKSEFWAQIAAHLNMPFTRMNMDGHLTRSDIIGVNRLIPGENGGTEMRFIEGILPRAMSRPGVLLIDEMDLGDPEIMPILQPVLEGNALVLLEDGGRVVQPHPMFRIAITGNTTGLGSDNQMYLNAFEQSAATRDRISAFVHMPYMPQDIEEQVVMARHKSADPDFINKLVTLANKVRDGYRNGDVQTLFSTRAVLYCAKRHSRLAGLYPSPDAAAQDILETVIMNRLDSASTQTVKELIDQIFV